MRGGSMGVRMATRAGNDSSPVFLIDASWLSSRITLRYEIDPEEDERRRRLSLGAVTDIGVLSATNTLPGDDIGPLIPGCGSTLDDVLSSGLVTAVLDVDGSVWARRIGGIALWPVEAILRARTLRSGLRSADRLAGYAPRSILIPSDRAMDDALLSEACFYGVGVRVGASVTRSEVLLAPASLALKRMSAEWWHFTESMYVQHLAGVSDSRTHLQTLSQF